MIQERKTVTGIVQKNMKLAQGVYEMTIETNVCKDFRPGQFINIYLGDKSMLLPRPISICEATDESVTIVYKVAGKGTACLSAYRTGGWIKLSTPLGNGYIQAETYAGKRVALVAGGIGIPPMIGLARDLKKRQAKVHVFLGFQSELFLAEKIQEYSEAVAVATDSGGIGFHGNVIDMLKADGNIFDEYFSCGPKAMLKTLSAHTSKIERNVQASIEERMGCGYGACVGCSCKIKENGVVFRKSVCKHGPVFLGKDVVWDD